MTKHTHSTKNLKPLKRKQAVFITSAILIGILFLVSIILVLTKQFRPSADEPNTAQSPAIKIQNGVLKYRTGDRDVQVGINPVQLEISLTLVQGVAKVKGLAGNPQCNPVIEGTLKVANKSTGQEIASTALVSQKDSEANVRKFALSNPSFTDKLLEAQGPFHVTLQLTNYLPLVADVNDIFETVTFAKEANAGNYDNNLVIDEADFAKWAPNFGKTVGQNPTLSVYDVDGNCQVDEADFAKAYSGANFGSRGDE